MAFANSASSSYTTYRSPHAPGTHGTTWDTPLNGGPAGYWSRIGAAFLDYTLWFPVQVFALTLLREPLGLEDGDLFGLITGTAYRSGHAVTALCLQFSYSIYLSIADGYGGSIGKRLMRLRVIDMNSGRNLGIPRALLRQIVARTISSWFCLLGYITALFNDDKRTWHDVASGAQIVRARDTRTVSVVSSDVVVVHR